ncbi:MAG: metabolite traffic protein EboE [Pseudomonadota bacterium]
MRLPGGLGELTYCLNIHPTQSWAEAEAALLGPVRAVKSAVCPDAPFAVGLRFSAETLGELNDPVRRARLADICAAEGFKPLTMNGFPYGPFHGARVKEDVYQPDWGRPERLAYTIGLAELLAEANPEGSFISLSTVPGCFKPLAEGREAAMAEAMLQATARLVDLRARTGRTVALALEPEPFCFLETIAETVAFFRDHLFSAPAIDRLAALARISAADAAKAAPRHLGLCYDVCHAAVEYEDAAASLAALRAAGVPVHKLQLSSALRLAQATPEARAALARFDEPTYLHQVHRRAPSGARIMHSDLGEALAAPDIDPAEEWRVHFHVPVFLDALPDFDTTQAFLAEVLALHRADPISSHLEVETYTWDVLPPGLAAGSVDQAVARELDWVRGRLTD